MENLGGNVGFPQNVGRPHRNTGDNLEQIVERVLNRHDFDIGRNEHPYFVSAFPDHVTQIELPRGTKVPNFLKFAGALNESTVEHIARYLVECGDLANNEYLKMKYFPSLLTKHAFTWFTTLPPNSINTWVQSEGSFHEHFFREETKVSIVDLMNVKRQSHETLDDYLNRFRQLKSRCYTNIPEHELVKIAATGLDFLIRKKLVNEQLRDMAQLAEKVRRIEQIKLEKERLRKFDRFVRKEKVAYSENAEMSEDTNYDILSEDFEVNLAELRPGPTYQCQMLKPGDNIEGSSTRRYSFDVTKADKIFDFRDMIEKAITDRRLAFKEKDMKVDTDQFAAHTGYVEPVSMAVNMVEVNIEDDENIEPILDEKLEEGDSLVEFLSKKKEADREVMLCPRCSAVFDRAAAKAFEESKMMRSYKAEKLREKPKLNAGSNAGLTMRQVHMPQYNAPMGKMEMYNSSKFEKRKTKKNQRDQEVSEGKENEKTEVKMDQEVENVKEENEQESELKLDCIFDDSPLGFERAAKKQHKLESQDPLEEINLGTVENRKVTYISKFLQRELKEELIRVLHDYKDCFAWDYDEMPGLDRGLVEHRLPIKDEYPMPIAKTMIDAAAGNEIMGYNQIYIAANDVSKIAFRCPGALGVYEWVMMPFGLKNAGATYQRAMNLIFHNLIGKFIQVYINDIIFGSKQKEDHLCHLKLSFERMRKHGLKMNPLKCAFGVTAGEFLGFVIHQKGIEVDRNKTKVIMETKPPSNKKELQSLLGKVNFLRRFISNFSGKTKVFSPLLRLKKEQEFQWNEEHQKEFEEIKDYLAHPPVPAPLSKGKQLKLYISASDSVWESMADLKPHNILISDYPRKSSHPEGMILLDVQIGSVKRTTMFIVTPSKTNFNILLRREWIHEVGAVPSTVHQNIFFWNDDEGLEVLEADQKAYEVGMYFADQQLTAFAKTKPFDAYNAGVMDEEEGVKKIFCWDMKKGFVIRAEKDSAPIEE
uniref:Retrotransposable element Tf2 n=2 Tax=Cajanus cajan TaxID=3821 RepID=A0A151UFP1_CAJCA